MTVSVDFGHVITYWPGPFSDQFPPSRNPVTRPSADTVSGMPLYTQHPVRFTADGAGCGDGGLVVDGAAGDAEGGVIVGGGVGW